jgi:hypothetical protein
VYDAVEGKLLRCGIKRKKNLIAILRYFSVVSHNGKKPHPLYPTTEKNSSVVSHNDKKLKT